MGYVFTHKDAMACEQWASDPCNAVVAELETGLMFEMLRPLPGDTVLDIGCGVGVNTALMMEKGLDVTGMDPSSPMLDMAANRVCNRLRLCRGFAEDIPFDDNSFNHVVFFNTLEFVDTPSAALEEACRVAKDKVFVGVMNPHALKGIQRRIKGAFSTCIYSKARFFSVRELKAELRRLAGNIPIEARTVDHIPFGRGRIVRRLAAEELVKKLPFGAFAGVSASLVPRFRTRPLPLKYAAKKPGVVVGGVPVKTRDREKTEEFTGICV
ncbi:MAG: methyltransferase domain-containing protein [Thermodesulfobacteriota bacterium]|nr:methyltransferase domain-containing protein [Thermodesulfobacteriota bacterium]